MALVICALFFFACLDSATKYLATRFNVPLIVAVRYIVQCSLMVVIFAPSKGQGLLKTNNPKLVVVRACCLAVSSLFYSLALSRMPVAETTAINFLGPMLVVLVAHPVLGERIGKIGWLALIIGFLGVLLVVHPGGGLDVLGIGFVLIAVAANVVYQLLSRVLADSEQTIVLLFYTALIGALGFGAFLPWSWSANRPTPWELLIFFGTGILGGIGHYLYTLAYRFTSAALLAPVNYLQLLWAGILGWLFFRHLPDFLSLIGMFVILLSGGLIAIKARFPMNSSSMGHSFEH